MKQVTIGIDIGGTNTVFGFVDRKGKILIKESFSTTKFPKIEDYINELTKQINVTKAKINENIEIAGMGIGAPNGNYYQGTIENAPNLSWEGIVPFTYLIKQNFDFPITLTNDANAAAIGEMIYGGAKDMKNFVVITLGTGLGSGIVINEELVYGHTGLGGEMGHTVMVPNGRSCGCGRQGCLENYVSATGITRTFIELLAQRKYESSLRAMPSNQITSRMIADAAIENDKIALEAFDKTAEMLALSIVNLTTLISPEAIFIFGGLANSGELLFKPLRSYVNSMGHPIFKNSFKIYPSQIEEQNAAILGAVALAWKELEK